MNICNAVDCNAFSLDILEPEANIEPVPINAAWSIVVGKSWNLIANTDSATAYEPLQLNEAELFINELHRFWDANLTNIFRRDKDIRVADSVLHIFRIKENIENFNKKALYILIREMTGSNTQHITRIINVMKKFNDRLFHEFDKFGVVDVTYTGSLIRNDNQVTTQ